MNRKDEIITGVFFIAATTTAIAGAILYQPVLKYTDFLNAVDGASTRVSLGALFELLLAFANIGTGIILYAQLKRYSESWGLGYALFRLLEVLFILIGVISMLTIVKLSHQARTLSGTELSSVQNAANVLKTIYNRAFILGPHFMLGINTFIYSSIFYRTGLLPRKLALLGMLGAVLVFCASILDLMELVPQSSPGLIVLAIPVAVYEMVLAGRLILKGFEKAAGAALPQ